MQSRRFPEPSTPAALPGQPGASRFAELCGIILETVGLAEPLRKALELLTGQIQAAFVYGSVAKRQDTVASDNDLMVTSDSLSYGDTYAGLEEAAGLGGVRQRFLHFRATRM